MTMIMNLTSVLSIISVLLLIALLTIYIRNMKHAKSNLLTGLLIFVSIFLVQNIVSLYYYFTMIEYYVPQVEIHVFILTLLQTIAFAVMLKVTWD